MCTVVVLRRPGNHWPLLLAANRDEMADRAWQLPGRHWPAAPWITAGRDLLGGGSWFGINDDGVAAAVLNRINTLGPAPGRRSRGELPLLALAHSTAGAAAAAIGNIDPTDYRSFNMVVADSSNAFYIRAVSDGGGTVALGSARQADSGAAPSLSVEPLPDGLSMITAYDRDDPRSPRIRRYRPRFAAAPVPLPEHGDWGGWVDLLGARDSDPDAGPGGAMTVVTTTGFGTVCSALLALPAPGTAGTTANSPADRPQLLFAAGRPDEVPFEPIRL